MNKHNELHNDEYYENTLVFMSYITMSVLCTQYNILLYYQWYATSIDRLIYFDETTPIKNEFNVYVYM